MIKLRLSDCFDIFPYIEDSSIDLVLVDLPYGITNEKWDKKIDLSAMWEQLNRICKSNTAQLFFSTQPFTTTIINSNIKNFKHDWIWNKKKPSAFQLAKFRPLPVHESIIVFSKGKCPYFPIKEKMDKARKSKVYSNSNINVLYHNDRLDRVHTEKYPKTILEYSNANQQSRLHPSQKSVPLLCYLIKTYTQKEDTVLDFCMGSGSTAIACIITERSFIGIEKEEKYFEIAKQRIKNEKEKLNLWRK